MISRNLKEICIAVLCFSSMSAYTQNINFFPATNFTIPGLSTYGIVSSDFNHDGDKDVAMPADMNTIAVLLGDGTGGFGSPVEFTVENNPLNLAVGDFNNDTHIDLVMSHFSIGSTMTLLLGDGTGGFGAPLTFELGFSGSWGINVGDFNEDGNADVIVTSTTFGMAILLGNGAGGFSAAVNYSTPGAPSFIAIRDVNNDSHQDLAIANQGGNNVSVFIGTGTGSFNSAVNYPVQTSPIGISIDDFNQDGKMDIAAANLLSKSVSVLQGDGLGNFGSAVNFNTGGESVGLLTNDFDNDGVKDIAITNRDVNSVSILRGNGAGGFEPPLTFSTGEGPRGITLADFNSDGRNDLATAGYTSGILSILLFNATSVNPTISGFTPSSGNIGTTVTITGTNFDPILGNNTVSFNGTTAATPLAASSTSITVLVPTGATTGPIGVTTSAGTGTSSSDFSVTVPIIISPQPLSNSVCESETVQFSIEASGTSNLTYQWEKLSNEAASLSALRWEIPSISPNTVDVDDAVDPSVITTIMGGTAGTSYAVTLRFRGVVETKAYTGGITNGFWNAGGTPDISGFNVYELTVSDPPGIYYLNAGSSDIYHCFAIDYEQTIPINAGATVQLKSETRDNRIVRNKDQFGNPIVINDIPPSPAAFNGQFIQMDVVAVDGVGYAEVNGGDYAGVESNTLTINTSGGSVEGIYRCKVSGDLAEDTYSQAAALTVNTVPLTPTASNNSGCSATAMMLSAFGASSGQYRWYAVPSGGQAIAGFTNETFTTPTLTNTTSYWVAINDGSCESIRTEVVATVIPLPTSPQVQQPEAVCPSSNVVLTASGSTDGNYRWYENNNIISGEVNGSFTINELNTSRNFQVSVLTGCESNRISVSASVKNCTAPVVAATTTTAYIEGNVTINLEPLISDAEDDIDAASLILVEQPISGAPATLSGFELNINYSGFAFTGTDRITIGVCDLTNRCTEQELTIELGGEVSVYNALSPNGDGKNEIFRIQYIDILPETRNNTVLIYNRWGDEVFSVKNYDNTTRVFRGESSNGKKLPAGTYFYKIVMEGRKTLTGYLSLKY